MNLITDRTKEDVTRLIYLTDLISSGRASKQDIESWWEALARADYNADTIKRVEGALEELEKRMEEFGLVYHLQKTDTLKNWWTVSEADQYLDNFRRIRAATPLPENAPKLPSSMDGLDVFAANNLERLLKYVDGILDWIQYSFFYNGEISSGEV